MHRTTANEPALLVAAAAGGVHAAFSLYWAFGGTFLLETLGETAQRFETAPVAAGVVLAAAALVKGWLALAPLAVARRGVPAVRGLLWLAAAGLAAYGLALTVAGALALSGTFGPVADPTALRGHALLWDPLFALWGVALAVGLWRSRATAARLVARAA